MRRHVAHQIEKPEKDGIGILILLAMWTLALMALSSAARGQQLQTEKQTSQPALNPTGARSTGSARSTSPQTDDQITLTRFILISVPNRQLALVDGGQVVKVYPIAVGARHTPSPHGMFTVISRVANPTWTHKGKVVAPGSDNPVGSRWIGLSLKGYGIHGTNAPRSIGKAASHGCFRMGKKELEDLFSLVHVGDAVIVRAQRDELVTRVFGNADGNGEVQVASAKAPVTSVETVAGEAENR